MEKSLESIIIPTGGMNPRINRKRTDVAISDYFERMQRPYVLISGWDCASYSIYRDARKRGLVPSDFIIERRARDTLGNFLYSVEELKKRGINSVKIATNPTHYMRFRLFEKKARKEGIIDDDFIIEPDYTSESPGDFVYGILAYVKDYFRLKSAGSMKDAKNREKGTGAVFLKRLLSKRKHSLPS